MLADPGLFVYAPDADSSLVDAVVGGAQGQGVDVWVDRRAELMYSGGTQADAEMYGRPFALALVKDIDAINDSARMMRQIITARMMNPLRVTIVASQQPPQADGPWMAQWGAYAGLLTIGGANVTMLPLIYWLLALDGAGDSSPIFPDVPPPVYHYIHASALYFRQRYTASLGEFQRLRSMGADAKVGLTAQACNLLALKRWEEAADVGERAYTSDEDRCTAAYCWGVGLARSGQAEKALGPLGRALSVAPDYGAAWLERGRALTALGRKSEALSAFKRARMIQRINPWSYENEDVFSTAKEAISRAQA